MLSLVVVLVLFASCTSAHRSLSNKAMHKDLFRLEQSIRKTHPAVGYTVSDESLLSLRDKIDSRLPQQATTLEYAQLIYPLLDTVQGGHIGLYPRGALLRHNYQSRKHVLPLSLKQLDSGPIVISALKPGQDSSLLGAEVLFINGQPINKLVAEANVFAGGSDGHNRSGARDRAITNLPTFLRWTLGKQDSFQVKLRMADRDSMLTAYSLATIAKTQKAEDTEVQLRPKNREKTINYGFDASRKTAVIDLNSFSGYDPLNFIFPMVLKGVLAKAEKDSAQTIILDLRDNGGGRSANVLKVLRYFVRDETKVFDPWTMPSSGWARASLLNKAIFTIPVLTAKKGTARFGRFMRHKIKPHKKSFDGKLIVLINSGSFSAATITGSILKSNDRAILMGQEAGGNYHETYAGLFSMIGLRRSGLVVRMPHLLIPASVDESKQPFGKTLEPDIAVPITVQDVFDPRDRLLLQALELSVR